jgi:quinol monooxygenase YgiN
VSEPIVFISINRIKPGKREALAEFSAAGVGVIEATKPGTVLFHAYVDEADEEVCFVHAFGDAEAMDRHLEGADERARAAYEYIEPKRFEIYGTPSQALLDAMRNAAGDTIEVVIRPGTLGGFMRLAAG